MARSSDTDLGFVVLGLLAWVVAGMFAIFAPTVEVDAPTAAGGKVTARTTNLAAVGASCGFAIAGGLCFLGAALATRKNRPSGSA
jgi:hypothetical protein